MFEPQAETAIEHGCFPETGRFSVEVWARLLGRGKQTILNYIAKYNVPHKKPGDETYIDAGVFWEHIPTICEGSDDGEES